MNASRIGRSNVVVVVVSLVGVMLIVGGVVIVFVFRSGDTDVLALFLGFAGVVVTNILAIVQHSATQKDVKEIKDVVSTPPEGIQGL